VKLVQPERIEDIRDELVCVAAPNDVRRHVTYDDVACGVLGIQATSQSAMEALSHQLEETRAQVRQRDQRIDGLLASLEAASVIVVCVCCWAVLLLLLLLLLLITVVAVVAVVAVWR
jgi:hypothetical protein